MWPTVLSAVIAMSLMQGPLHFNKLTNIENFIVQVTEKSQTEYENSVAMLRAV